MRPSNAFLSLRRGGGKITFLLTIGFLIQASFLGFSSRQIPLPEKLTQWTLNSFLSEEIQVEIREPRLTGLSRMECSSLVLIKTGKRFAKFDGLSIRTKPSQFGNGLLAMFSRLETENFVLFSDEPSDVSVQLKKVVFASQTNSPGQGFFSGNLIIGPHQFSILATLPSLQQNELPSENPVDWKKFTSHLEEVRSEVSNWSQKFPPSRFYLTGLIRGDGGEVIVRQANDSSMTNLDGGLAKFSWQNPSKTDSSFSIRGNFAANSLSLASEGSSFSVLNPLLGIRAKINPDGEDDFNFSCSVRVDSVVGDGVISGTLPSAHLLLDRTKENLSIRLFSHSKPLKASVIAERLSNEWQARGHLDLKPEHLDVEATLPQGVLRIINGDFLSIRLDSNHAPIKTGSPTQCVIKAENFSALESPSGDYSICAEIASDLTIWINDAWGKMGRSEVTGSYHQKWMPNDYRFLIKGNCHPPDIENWLGIWWTPLWAEFDFAKSVPWGDFSIEGTWGGEPGNSITEGWVRSGAFDFRDLPISNSSLEVVVDKESTRLRSSGIKHDHGTLSGFLEFPRSMMQTHCLLSFEVTGDFPLNQAKGIFGPRIRKSLKEVNATVVGCIANGQIFDDDAYAENEQNQTRFEITLQADKPFSYSGIPLDFADGRFIYRKGLLRGEFPNLGICGGSGSLSFLELSEESDLIQLAFELSKASSYLLLKNLPSTIGSSPKEAIGSDGAQNEDSIVVEPSRQKNKGLIDFSLQAEGPFANPLQFQGTGNFRLSDVEIGTMNILGGIRSKLGSFNFPLPSDALRFDRLEAPFLLENDIIRFDEAKLGGPVSLLLARGSFDLAEKEVDINAELKIAGNLNIPLIKQIVNFADPLSRFSAIRIIGPWENPNWTVHLTPEPLSP